MSKIKSKRKRHVSMEIADDGDTLASFLVKRRRASGAVLPDDVVGEILLRVDYRSVIQSSAVCKRWRSLVDNNRFVGFYGEHNRSVPPQKTSVLVNCNFRLYCTALVDILGEDPSSAWWRDLSLVPDFKYLPIRAASSDLMLLSRLTRRYFIMNAFTKQFLALPKVALHNELPHGFALVCRLPNYRVVLLRCAYFLRRSYVCHIAIFDSEAGLWTRSYFLLPSPVEHGTKRVDVDGIDEALRHVVHNSKGVLHWLVGNKGIYGLAAFDPFSMERRLIPLPSTRFRGIPIGDLKDKVHVGVVQGRVRISLMEGDFDIRIWELDSSNDSWTLKDCFKIRKTEEVGLFFVVCLDPDDDKVVFCVNGKTVWRYVIGQHNAPMRICRFPCEGESVDEMRLNVGRDLRVYTIVHPTWPTPISSLAYPPSEDI